MGWKGYEAEIAIGMLFKKMYCDKCGKEINVEFKF